MSETSTAIVGGVRRFLPQLAAAIYGMIGRPWLHDRTGDDRRPRGYFFTFISLAAARTVAELGLGQAMIVKMRGGTVQAPGKRR